MNKLFLLFLLTFFILFAGCQCGKSIVADNPYGLPNATQTGANTFACLINAKKFIAYYDPSNGTGAKVKNDTLGITGSPKVQNHYEFLGFQIIGSLANSTNYSIDLLKNCYG